MKRMLFVLSALALAACQPKPAAETASTPPGPAAPAPAPGMPPPSGSIDISKGMTAIGTEPFWGLTIDGTRMKLTRPDKPDLLAEAPGAVIQAGRATWIAKAADGQQITVVLYASDCSDGMSDRAYAFTAEVAMINETLRGCAYRTSDPPKGGA